MPLPWVRLDSTFPSNPKLLALLTERDGHRAALAYICSLAYCGAHGTDGFITPSALPYIHARPKDAQLLVRYRLWHGIEGVGWNVNGWSEFQPSSEETRERAARYRQAALKANCARWHEKGCTCWEEPA